jgi:DNA-directed RNA polymerase specialized sigma24 family protein
VDVRKLTEDERRELREVVLLAAYRATRSISAAADLTQEAFLRLDTTRPWDPSRPTSLEQHMLGIIRSLLSHQRASDAKRREFELQAGTEMAYLSDAGRSAEATRLDRADRVGLEALATKRVAALRVRVAAFELDLRILDLMADDVTKRAELALRTGRSLDEVKTALARIRRHMQSILAAERGEDEEVK